MPTRKKKKAPKKPGAVTLDLNPADLQAFRDAAPMAGKGELGPPVLNSVHFTAGGFVVTDTHRLLRYCSPALAEVPEVTIAADWIRFLRDQRQDATAGQLTFGEEGLELKLPDGERLTGGIVKGRFPDWSRVVSEEWIGRAVAPAGDWEAAFRLLGRLRETARAETGLPPELLPPVQVTLAAADERVRLRDARPRPTEHPIAWELRTALPAAIALSGTRQVSFGAQLIFLQQAVRALGQPAEAPIELWCHGPRDAFVFKPEGSDHVFVATMPMLPHASEEELETAAENGPFSE